MKSASQQLRVWVSVVGMFLRRATKIRLQLIASVFGEDAKGRKKAKNPSSLESFSHNMIDKWRSGGLGSITGKEYQLRFAMMVRDYPCYLHFYLTLL